VWVELGGRGAHSDGIQDSSGVVVRRDILGCGPDRLRDVCVCVVDGWIGGWMGGRARWIAMVCGVFGRGLRLLVRLMLAVGCWRFGGCPSVRQQQKHVCGMVVRGA